MAAGPHDTESLSNHRHSVGHSSSIHQDPEHSRRARSTTAGSLSSSYKIPARSFVHRASHGAHDAHYASFGVHQQTAELTSSLLSNTNYARLDDSLSRPTLYRDEPSHDTSIDARLDNSTCAVIDEDAEGHEVARPFFSPGHDSPRSSLDVLGADIGSHVRKRPLLEERLVPDERDLLIKVKSHEVDDDYLEHQSRPSPPWYKFQHAYPSLHHLSRKTYRTCTTPKSWNLRKVRIAVLDRPISVLPAVFLGLLLNLLDALSYGIILFPLGVDAFSSMGPDGVSMFYISCIVSQIVYSTGSIFRGGVGSEMIEVVPFFHKMTFMIMNSMGTGDPEALRATVITSFAMSSILTGIVFFALGTARLGTLVSFFPHSILTGCVGGVGIFLFVTGVEVSARFDGELSFTQDTLHQLFSTHTMPLWIPPLVLAITLLAIKRFYDRAWLVPAFYIAITTIFYVVVLAVPQLSIHDLRYKGWIFDAPAGDVPFYHFYTYYNFKLVDWHAIWLTIPTQLALTFFGILHVPINVPNLAQVVQEDNVNVDRELLLHGLSNTISGALGSVQNYLVFVNSVLFMNTGGDSRLAGYMLAAATFGLLLSGSVTLGFVPVMVVGTLIHFLGIDLALEALWSTYGRLHRLEYITIVVIALVMGFHDFVVGIAIGIGLACLVYVVQTSRKSAIRAEFSGAVAESTVRRPLRQRRYLHRVGPQIRVVKLGGYLFFGSIVNVEKKVRALIDAEAFAAAPIHFLLVDLEHVTGIDFSAAEAFSRMNRIVHRRNVRLALSGVSLDGELGRSLRMVGLFAENDDEEEGFVPPPKVFETLNDGLESCENELLTILTEKQRTTVAASLRQQKSQSIDIPSIMPPVSPSAFPNVSGASPRYNLLQRAATATIEEQRLPDVNKWMTFKQPLPLLLQAFQDLSSKNEDFWFRASHYFQRKDIAKGESLYKAGEPPDGFYILQSGLIRAESELDQGRFQECIVSGTTCGELPFFSETRRTSTAVAELDCVAWLLTPEMWRAMQDKDADLAQELLKVGMKLSAERMSAITSYVLITAS